MNLFDTENDYLFHFRNVTFEILWEKHVEPQKEYMLEHCYSMHKRLQWIEYGHRGI